MPKLAFRHVGPSLAHTITVPPMAVQVSDYFLVYDPARRAFVYGTAPDYHQVGHAWTFDGRGFTAISETTYQVGSQEGTWTGLYDPTRKAVVAWGFDNGSGPYGVVIGDTLSVILHETAVEDHESMDQTAKKIVVTGDRPAPLEGGAWINLVGIFGMDPEREVTVCLTQAGVYELAGDRWTRVADAPAKLPAEVDGECGGAGAVWDAARSELVFWLYDHDTSKVWFMTWDGRTATKLATTGLPTLWKHDDNDGFAIGDHPQHGVVAYAGPKLGLYGRTDEGWQKLGAGEDAPARSTGGRMAYDPLRDALVLGPYKVNYNDQNVLHELITGRWTLIGATSTRSLLADLSSGTPMFGKSRGVMYASGLYLKTIAWDPQTSWREVVNEKAGDKARGDARAQAFVTAWDGVLHAVMDDGGVLSLDAAAKWKPRTTASSTWKAPFFPLVAFDAKRGVLVAWGSQKKSGGRKNETYVFDGAIWKKASKAKDKPADLELDDTDAFALFYDTSKQQVARLGKTELAHFDGETWITTKLRGSKLLETWRRCVCHDPVGGGTVIVNLAAREVVRLVDGAITKFGEFDPPAKRDEHDNLPFDHWWFDEQSLSMIVHNEIDDAQSFALDLRPAFAG